MTYQKVKWCGMCNCKAFNGVTCDEILERKLKEEEKEGEK